MTETERRIEKRRLQKLGDEKYTHPKEKEAQIRLVLGNRRYFNILELFAGNGNLTKVYQDYLYKGFGKIHSYDIKTTKEDSFRLFHKFIYQEETYDIIDIDPFGFPCRLFPDIFMLIDYGYLFLTFCKPHKIHPSSHLSLFLKCYFGEEIPRLDNILTGVKKYSNFHWRDANVVNVLDLPGVWRIAFSVTKVMAKEFSWGKVSNSYRNSIEQVG
jgi:hypothetical protein